MEGFKDDFFSNLSLWGESLPDYDVPFLGVFDNGEAYIFMLTEDRGLINYVFGCFSIFDEKCRGFQWQDTNYPYMWRYI